MFKTERIQTLLSRIEEAINLIEENSSHIKSAQDFLYSSDGMFTLSGICMQLIFIGESVKVLDAKTEHDYLLKYPNIPWNDIMGLRDIIAHEYHHIDAEEIFKVIKIDLPILHNTILKMKSDF
ncbi:HepT-like ribonuclease domain-containing protein [uncultured Bacteroides sp.]|uniref:HepT-like ribonuclease domain-containing protein n=1 Tax=uncultured Bacteroides sp. TaxID=162156 RepID=UPI0025850FC5|nr:HepT-like ribonuclease domain-containing protein [uncultured Bacteroides sp.]